jgi:stage III sporulation protein AA
MRSEVDRLGKETLQELRLRLNSPSELLTPKGSQWINDITVMDDLLYCINAASRYSPWAARTSASGYITAPGGHRLGLCGDATVIDGEMRGITKPTSICLRVARDFCGIAKNAAKIHGSILILGKPGNGKTTLLRDLIRQKSEQGSGSVAVVDERGELFPHTNDEICFPTGRRTDILTGCPKPAGIESVLRNMSPSIIAVDEITAQEDCDALIQAGWCGVTLLATAHAESKKDLYSRPVYKPIINSGLFETLLILQPDKSWRMERMAQ